MKSGFKLIIFILLLLIFAPVVFAEENETSLSVDETVDSIPISVSNNEDTLKESSDYYFNSSSENDGNGTIDNPYKYLSKDRITANSNLYFTNGEYSLNESVSISNVNIIGSDSDKTVIVCKNIKFNVNNILNVKNVTLIGLTISNPLTFTANNTIFKESKSAADSYGNTYGGAIYASRSNANIIIDNCTLKIILLSR